MALSAQNKTTPMTVPPPPQSISIPNGDSQHVSTVEHATNIDLESATHLLRLVAAPSVQDTERVSQNGGVIHEFRSHSEVSAVRQLVCWIVVGFIVFTMTWKSMVGGYRSSLPLFAMLTLYAYGRHLQNVRIFKHLLSHIKENITHILRKERRSLMLLLAYAVTKVGFHLFYPELEKSNGSPMSLILFTVYFIAIFILPSLAIPVGRGIVYMFGVHKTRLFVDKLGNQLCCGNTLNGLSRAISRWKKSIIFTFIAVTLSYVFDGDLTCILRYFGHGDPCWPLLVPRSLQDTLPYPLQHAWIKEWHRLFSNYKPSNFVLAMIVLGREMEVIHVLPTLIGTYVLAQLLLPRENWIIKKVLFGGISSVVLSGVTSGALKILLHRYRPNAYGNPYMWTGPGTATVNHLAFSKLDLSFPCGHTTVSMSIAACLYLGVMHSLRSQSCSLKLKMFLITFIFFYPMVVLISRVSECNHWTSDAIFGVRFAYSLPHPTPLYMASDILHEQP